MVRSVVCLSLLSLVGCSEYELGHYVAPVEEPIEVPVDDDCVGSQTGFDIEQVSTLQDAPVDLVEVVERGEELRSLEVCVAI